MAAEQGAAARDLQWEAYFANPGGYYDNRTNKTNPKAPDFKSKADGCADPEPGAHLTTGRGRPGAWQAP